MNKKGVSGVIATVMMIALVLVVVSVVWVSINNLIGEKIDESEACFGNFGKVTLEKKYTCQNVSSGEFQFSINVGDITVDSVLVSVGSVSAAKSITINGSSISNVKMYGGVSGGTISLPGKNSGFTYVIDLASFGVGTPNSIKIAPIINSRQCDVSDSLATIENC
jgi:flagellin-like protein